MVLCRIHTYNIKL